MTTAKQRKPKTDKSAQKEDRKEQFKRQKILFLNMSSLLRFLHLNILVHSPCAVAYQEERLAFWLGKGKNTLKDDSVLSGQEIYASRILHSTQYASEATPIANTPAAIIFEKYYFYTPVITELFEIAKNEIKHTKPDVMHFLNVALNQVKVIQDYILQNNIGLVKSLIEKQVNKGVIPYSEVENCRQAGLQGLWQAIYKYNPTQGTQFSTMATNWIKASVNNYLASTPKTLRIPRHKQNLFARIRVFKNQNPHANLETAINVFLTEYLEEEQKKGVQVSETKKQSYIKDVKMFFEFNIADTSIDENSDERSRYEKHWDVEPMYTDTHENIDRQNTQKIIDCMSKVLLDKNRLNMVVARLGLIDGYEMTDREIAKQMRMSKEEVSQGIADSFQKLGGCSEFYELLKNR